MELRIMTEPQQGADYGRQLAVARATEQLGFDAFFRSDHYLSMGDGDGLPGPTDAWLTLAGLALQTSRIKLGTLVSPITFRFPGPLAISVAQVDDMSDGRVELGIRTPPSGSTGSKSSSRSSPACGTHLPASGFRSRGSFTRSPTHPGCPSQSSARTRPSCSAARGPGGLRGSPPGTPTSSPCRSPASRRPGPRSAGSVRRARRPDGTRTPSSTRPRRRSAAAGTRPSWPA